MKPSKWKRKPCGKTAYPASGTALTAMRRMKPVGNKAVPIRVYPCPYKNGYHLTSKVLRERVA